MDILLVFTQLTLGMLGVLGIATSEASTGLIIRQTIAVFAGLGLTYTVARFSPKRIIKNSPLFYVITLLLLILVLFIGSTPAGSAGKRWLLLGPISFQPSELMKVAIIAYLTAFFYNHYGNWELWRPMLLVGAAVGLILLEPNFSTSLFIFYLAIAIMLIAGTRLVRLFSIGIASSIVALLFAIPLVGKYGYFVERISHFINKNPEVYIGSQADLASRALRNAGFFGIGPGTARYVPEAHTDMIAISIAQALGLTGIITVIILYIFIAGRGVRIAAETRGPGSLLAAGATAYICSQAALNLLVASGLLPVTGVVLPFVSHGLNSMVSVSIALGFLHSAYRQARLTGARL
ncbi:MAG: FtsW/RodA/SpoVE family cell cycle protein [Trueperaceae bacterium]|nr:FtsW/RodA/SpoVE family cell cycle protein [Trueperaceae bacterium]